MTPHARGSQLGAPRRAGGAVADENAERASGSDASSGSEDDGDEDAPASSAHLRCAPHAPRSRAAASRSDPAALPCLSRSWDWLICDEGHKLKNPRMQLVAKISAVPAARRLLLTGTPVQNNLGELWALFNFVTPGLLGDARQFRDEFDKPISRGQSREASAREREAGAATAVALHRRIAPAFLRREKAGVLTAPRAPPPGAPPPAAAGDAAAAAAPAAPPPPPGGVLGHKSDMIVWLRLTPPQRRLYAAFLGSSSVAAALNKTGSALAALTVLKKICDHPGLLSQNAAAEIARGRPLASVLSASGSSGAADTSTDDAACDGDDGGAPAGACDPAASCKTAFVLAFVAAAAADGHRVLVFSQSRAMLDGIEAAARAASWRLCRIDGTVAAPERARRVAAFQSDASIPLFLLTSAVGGLGLTLTGADRVVVIDPSWNPAADAQAVDRAYRLGQTRDVAVYRLITCGTVEEKIYRKCVLVPAHAALQRSR
jgi:SNF2 family DNA or RNA helicase